MKGTETAAPVGGAFPQGRAGKKGIHLRPLRVMPWLNAVAIITPIVSGAACCSA
jgi:hypothetical protein